MSKINILLACILLLAGNFVFSQGMDKVKITELEKIIRDSREPIIVNFWATFCVPCIEEIPYFEELSEQNGIKLLLVSLDLEEYYPDKIRSFAAGHHFRSAITWLDEYDADYFCPKIDTNWSGAIPASLFVNNKTGYRKFIEEKISREKLEKEMAALLGKSEEQ